MPQELLPPGKPLSTHSNPRFPREVSGIGRSYKSEDRLDRCHLSREDKAELRFKAKTDSPAPG